MRFATPWNSPRIPMFTSECSLCGDAVQCAVAGQETHEGFYNVERMMSSLARRGEVAT